MEMLMAVIHGGAIVLGSIAGVVALICIGVAILTPFR